MTEPSCRTEFFRRMPMRQAGARETLRTHRFLFQLRGPQRGSPAPVFPNLEADDGLDSDEMEWEDLVLWEEDRTSRALTSTEQETPPYVGRYRNLRSDASEGDESAVPVSENGEGFLTFTPGFPCPDMWQIETFLTRSPAEETNPQSRTRGRQRRRSFDEDMHLTAMRHHLRRCLERSFSEQDAADDAPSEQVESIPAFSSLLSPGMDFKGFQRCPKPFGPSLTANPVDDWIVQAQIRRYDAASGYLCGTMSAFVKNNNPVETFWEGEIIDNKHHTFVTNKWHADIRTDLRYWTKEYPYIFMRWKERHFMTKAEQSLLTIQGFYYICMRRQTGEMIGYYFDPECQPFQELELSPDTQGRSGFVFSRGEFL